MLKYDPTPLDVVYHPPTDQVQGSFKSPYEMPRDVWLYGQSDYDVGFFIKLDKIANTVAVVWKDDTNQWFGCVRDFESSFFDVGRVFYPLKKGETIHVYFKQEI